MVKSVAGWRVGGVEGWRSGGWTRIKQELNTTQCPMPAIEREPLGQNKESCDGWRGISPNYDNVKYYKLQKNFDKSLASKGVRDYVSTKKYRDWTVSYLGRFSFLYPEAYILTHLVSLLSNDSSFSLLQRNDLDMDDLSWSASKHRCKLLLKNKRKVAL